MALIHSVKEPQPLFHNKPMFHNGLRFTGDYCRDTVVTEKILDVTPSDWLLGSHISAGVSVWQGMNSGPIYLHQRKNVWIVYCEAEGSS